MICIEFGRCNFSCHCVRSGRSFVLTHTVISNTTSPPIKSTRKAFATRAMADRQFNTEEYDKERLELDAQVLIIKTLPKTLA